MDPGGQDHFLAGTTISKNGDSIADFIPDFDAFAGFCESFAHRPAAAGSKRVNH